MKKLILITTLLFLAACSSPPKVNEPTGNWYQANSSHYYKENPDYRKIGTN